MSNSRYVLDTNIVAAILRKEPLAIAQSQAALRANAEFLICPVVFYEVYRGLLHKDASKQLAFFLQYITTFTWEDLAREDWEQAARLWSTARKQGRPIEDADLMIATFAVRRNAVLVTDNVKHFDPFVPVENWRR